MVARGPGARLWLSTADRCLGTDCRTVAQFRVMVRSRLRARPPAPVLQALKVSTVTVTLPRVTLPRVTFLVLALLVLALLVLALPVLACWEGACRWERRMWV
jgi:hypothetical protein